MKLRFTIRDLFWLTLLVAMTFGWWQYYLLSVEQLRRQHAADEQNIALVQKTIHDQQENTRREWESYEKTIRELYQKLGINLYDPMDPNNREAYQKLQKLGIHLDDPMAVKLP